MKSPPGGAWWSSPWLWIGVVVMIVTSALLLGLMTDAGGDSDDSVPSTVVLTGTSATTVTTVPAVEGTGEIDVATADVDSAPDLGQGFELVSMELSADRHHDFQALATVIDTIGMRDAGLTITLYSSAVEGGTLAVGVLGAAVENTVAGEQVEVWFYTTDDFVEGVDRWVFEADDVRPAAGD